MTVIARDEHYKAALERIVFVHADAPEVAAADLAEIAGEALDTAPSATTEGAVKALQEMRRDLHAVGHPTPLADCRICTRWDERIAELRGQ